MRTAEQRRGLHGKLGDVMSVCAFSTVIRDHAVDHHVSLEAGTRLGADLQQMTRFVYETLSQMSVARDGAPTHEAKQRRLGSQATRIQSLPSHDSGPAQLSTLRVQSGC